MLTCTRQKIRDLSTPKNIKQFFRDFLAMVEEDMLVVESNLEHGQTGRKTAHTVSTKLSDMVQNCEKVEGYI